MNVLMIAGRVSRDAEQRYTTNGKAVLGFSVATDVGFGDKKHALFVNCSLWGKRGEALAPYIKKGGQITVSGEADLREWESNGKSGTSLEMNVSEVALQGGQHESQEPQQSQGFRDKPAKTKDDFDQDDIPF